MRKTPCFVGLFAMLLTAACVGQSSSRLHFPAAGFSIAPLEAPLGELPRQALMMWLPPLPDGFSGNVNVQIQPYSGTMDEYVALTLKQFQTAGVKILEQKLAGRTTAVFEYTGEIQGRPLHWYARAEKAAAKVFLVTATAAESQWTKEAARLKACVDSFHCDNPAPGAANHPPASVPQPGAAGPTPATKPR